MPWIFVIIALAGAACLVALVWVLLFKVRVMDTIGEFTACTYNHIGYLIAQTLQVS